MSKLFKLIFGILLFASINANAQDDARSLIKEGIALSNAKDYAGAMEKFRSALVLEPGNSSANYQMAFTLNVSGKYAEAIPYVQKVTASGASAAVISSAYALLGSIYDRTAQPQKAIESFTAAIKLSPGDHLLHYSLGLAYFRARKYADAEQSAVNALHIQPQHPGSMRLYALVTFHQDKRAPALLALCRFLWLEPNGAKSAEAYGNIQSILSGGTLKPEPGIKPIDANNRQLNTAINAAAKTASAKKYATTADKFAGQLKEIFESIGQLAAKQTGNDTLFTVLAARYYKLSQTAVMPAYARFISQGSDKQAAAWVKAHPQKIEALKEWDKLQK